MTPRSSPAEKVLTAAGISAEAAHAADAWENAETAAFRVIFAGVERWPESTALTLR